MLKKRIITLFLSILMILTLLPSVSANASPDFEIKDGVLVKYTGSGGAVRIPNDVVSIGARAFEGCTSLTDITIPTSVNTIGQWAFSDCKGLTSVTMSNSVSSIGGGAFAGCTNLESITLPNTLQYIGDLTFGACESLTSISIPRLVSAIGQLAFYGCTNLTSVSIPDFVTSIGEEAFAYCPNLTVTCSPGSFAEKYCIENNISISLRTTTNPFKDTPGFEISSNGTLIKYTESGGDVKIPDGVTTIGERAFENCENLTSVSIPDSVKEIERWAFSGCTGLTSVTLPDSVTFLGENAFEDCTGLISVTISNSLNWIRTDVFINCTSLKSVVIPNSVTSIEPYAFANCSSLASITLPNSLTHIRYAAFRDCSSLTSITLPNSLTFIGPYAFQRCENLTSISIPQSVTEIGNDAFSYCKNLASVTLTNGITTVDAWTFYECESLKEVVIPDSVSTIEEGAFARCTSLTSIIIPNKVSSIGTWAFKDCPNLTAVCPPDSYAEEYFDENNIRYKSPGDTVKVYTVTTDANNSSYGTVSAPLSMQPGETVTIVASANSGYIFVGWEVLAGNVTLSNLYAFESSFVMPENNVSIRANFSVQPSKSAFSITVDSYKFQNNRYSFGYQTGYKIPLERYIEVFGEIEGPKFWESSEQRSRNEWGGSCFGFSSTAGLFFTGDLNVSQFGTNTVYDIEIPGTPSSEVTKLLEKFQISQFFKLVQNEYNYQISELIQAVKDFQQTGKNPVIVLMFGHGGGHAVIGYSVTEDVSGYTLNCYDNNFPGQTRTIRISSDKRNWENSDYVDLGFNSTNGGDLAFVYTSVIGENMKNQLNRTSLHLTVSSTNVEIYNANGVSVKDIPDAIQIKSFDNKQHNDLEYYLPPDTYYVVPNSSAKKNNEPIAVELSNPQNCITAKLDSSASQIGIWLGKTPSVEIEGASPSAKASLNFLSTSKRFSDKRTNIVKNSADSVTFEFIPTDMEYSEVNSLPVDAGTASQTEYGAYEIDITFSMDKLKE